MKRAFLFLLLTLTATAAFAQSTPAPAPAPAPDYPIVRVGMVSFLQYDAELKNRSDFNAFDVTRGYININAQLAKNFRFRFTPDIRRATDSSLSGSLLLR